MRVKKISLLLLLIIFSANSEANEVNKDDILGFWLSESGKGVIEVYKEKNKYMGKLVWIKDLFTGEAKERLDIHNPDKKLRSVSLMGLVNLKNFSFDEDEWSGGTIYDPKTGKTYKAYMSLKDSQTLKLRGYVGVPLFGRTSEWKRQKSAIPDAYVKIKKIETH